MLTVFFTALVLGALGLLFVSVDALQRRELLGPEGGRKMVHIGMGLVGLSLPWFFRESWPVWVMAALSGGVLAVVRLVPAIGRRLGGVLGKVERPSIGDVLFPLGVAVSFTIAQGKPVLFTAAMGVLTFGDTAGALVGSRCGHLKYSIFRATKSVEGSVAVLVVSAVWVAADLALLGGKSLLDALAFGGVIGLFAALVEAVSSHGLDNLLLPTLTVLALRTLERPPVNGNLSGVGILLVGSMALAAAIAALVFARS